MKGISKFYIKFKNDCLFKIKDSTSQNENEDQFSIARTNLTKLSRIK